ncbi:anti-sigma factor [Streptosporangiaceae bacterium NEAU-GS5]|nr:anti-sigma factor [Streptosporangiaceae bacterium NEAU-GS5]
MTDETVTPTEEVSGAVPGDVAGIRDAVSVRLPAVSAYLSVLRTATAGLAARLDFTLDQIEDLRIAVDEACAMLLRHAVPGTDLTAEFELTGQEMSVRVEVATVGVTVPKRDDFAWMVLTALADDVDAVSDSPDHMAIVLRKRRGAARPA